MSALKKFSALFEVFGIYIAGQLVGFILAGLFGIHLQNPLQSMSANPTTAEIWQVTGQLLVVLFFQYIGWFLLILPIGWWIGRRKPANYGLTLSGKTWFGLLFAGLVLFAFAELPGQVLNLANTYFPMGEQAAWRETIFRMNWNSLEFWALMAVGSYGLIPLVEELFYRGYCQSRLEEGLGAPAAILATACLFTFSHSQYLIFNAYNVVMLLALLFSAIAWGFIYYRTRSLLPTIAAHVLINLPIRGAALWGLLAAMLVICVIARKEIWAGIREGLVLLRSLSPLWQGLAAIAFCALFALGFALLGDVFILLGLVLFVAALVLDGIVRKREKKAVEAVTA
jgi:membrane protease YdiL (CAAX protease family)